MADNIVTVPRLKRMLNSLKSKFLLKSGDTGTADLSKATVKLPNTVIIDGKTVDLRKLVFYEE